METKAAKLTGFTLVGNVEVFGRARTGVLPKQQLIDRQPAISVALTLRQQLLHTRMFKLEDCDFIQLMITLNLKVVCSLAM